MPAKFQYSIAGGARRDFAADSLSLPRITRGNFQPDTCQIDHLAASWDADPLFVYRADITIWRVENGVATRVFRGLRRRAPRFIGAQAESLIYTLEGPWGWLQRRPFLQNQAIQPETGIGPPVMVQQGVVILGQADDGQTVQVGQALDAIVDYAIGIGVPIIKGDITGFDFSTGWDQMRDLQVADAITRLIQTCPDAVAQWDYTTENPTLHLRRREGLATITLAIAPKGTAVEEFGEEGYAEFETVHLEDRPDLVPPGVFATFRSIDTENGAPSLRLFSENAGVEGASPTDEDALVRTVELAGDATSINTLSQECVTGIIPVALGDDLTPANGESFVAVRKFFARAPELKWLLDAEVTLTKLTADTITREALITNHDTGEVTRDVPDLTLTREMIEGGVTPWMENTTLNRIGQEQEVNYIAEGHRTVGSGPGAKEIPFKVNITRAFLATNASTQTYYYAGSSDTTPGEPRPTDLTANLYAALSIMPYEGDFTLVERECSMRFRPGLVVNLTGGRAEWQTMNALVQEAAYDAATGRTRVTLGLARQLGFDDLLAVWRSNRRRAQALAGLTRATGLF